MHSRDEDDLGLRLLAAPLPHATGCAARGDWDPRHVFEQVRLKPHPEGAKERRRWLDPCRGSERKDITLGVALGKRYREVPNQATTPIRTTLVDRLHLALAGQPLGSSPPRVRFGVADIQWHHPHKTSTRLADRGQQGALPDPWPSTHELIVTHIHPIAPKNPGA